MANKKSRPFVAITVFLFAAGIFVAAVFSVGQGVLKNISLAPGDQKAFATGAPYIDLAGWVWSETIGWISLNDSNTTGAPNPYGVAVDGTDRLIGGTGNFTGYAWSETIGWVSFDRAVTGNPPAVPFNGGIGPIAQIDWSTENATGWARACAGTVNGDCTGGDRTDGWDGWIKLAGDGASWNGTVCTGTNDYAGTNQCNYGVKLNTTTGAFSGFAWGSDVVGWLDLSNAVAVLPGALTVVISANPTSVAIDNTTTLSWTTTGSVISCTAKSGSAEWTALGSTLSYPTGSWTSSPLRADPAYGIECTGPGGVVTGTVYVQVTVANSCGDTIISGTEDCETSVVGLCSVLDSSKYAPDANTYTCNTAPLGDCYNNTSACTLLTQCNDTEDNDRDGKIDDLDPGCHTDGNASNAASYDQTRNNELNIKKITPR